MKVLSTDEHRPRDAQDLVALLSRCSGLERQRAEDALRAIDAVGAARGRDLLADLARWTAQATKESP